MRNVHYQNKTLEILLPICPAETEKLYESIKKDTMVVYLLFYNDEINLIYINLLYHYSKLIINKHIIFFMYLLIYYKQPLLTQLRKSFKDQSNAVHESYIKLQNRYTQVNELKTELMEERDSKKKEFEQAKKYINDSREVNIYLYIILIEFNKYIIYKNQY